MIDCPNCGKQLMPDSSNPLRMKCTYCSYVLDPTANMDPLPGILPEPENAYPASSFSEKPRENSCYPAPQGEPVVAASPHGPVPPYAYTHRVTNDAIDANGVNGANGANGAGYVYTPTRPSQGLAIAALVLGILALVCCWLPFINLVSIILGILALIFSIISLVSISKGKAMGKGMSIAGLICGVVSIIISIVVSLSMYFAIERYLDSYYDYPYSYEEFIDHLQEFDDDLSRELDLIPRRV